MKRFICVVTEYKNNFVLKVNLISKMISLFANKCAEVRQTPSYANIYLNEMNISANQITLKTSFFATSNKRSLV